MFLPLAASVQGRRRPLRSPAERPAVCYSARVLVNDVAFELVCSMCRPGCRAEASHRLLHRRPPSSFSGWCPERVGKVVRARRSSCFYSLGSIAHGPANTHRYTFTIKTERGTNAAEYLLRADAIMQAVHQRMHPHTCPTSPPLPHGPPRLLCWFGFDLRIILVCRAADAHSQHAGRGIIFSWGICLHCNDS